MRIVGFSLFFNPERKQWQRSIRYEGETGWSITHIPEFEAQQVLGGIDGSGFGPSARRLTAAIEALTRNVK